MAYEYLDRKQVDALLKGDIYTNSPVDAGIIEPCDNVRVVRITAQKLKITEQEAIELLNAHDLNNPLKIEDEEFWVDAEE